MEEREEEGERERKRGERMGETGRGERRGERKGGERTVGEAGEEKAVMDTQLKPPFMTFPASVVQGTLDELAGSPVWTCIGASAGVSLPTLLPRPLLPGDSHLPLASTQACPTLSVA